MIDIHITGEGVRSQITNETAIDVMTALAEAVFHICKRNNLPSSPVHIAIITFLSNKRCHASRASLLNKRRYASRIGLL